MREGNGACLARPLGVKEGDGDDYELCGHEHPHEVEQDLEHRPALGLAQPPCPRGEDEGVPSRYGERTYEEILLRREMRREVEGRRENVVYRHDRSLQIQSSSSCN